MEMVTGFSAQRKLPQWRGDVFSKCGLVGQEGGPEVVLFADTFNRYFEPENVDAALNVLTGAGYRVHLPAAADGSSRPLCCGRTLLTAGLVDRARAEASRTIAALLPLVRRGIPVVGLEPSCIFTFRDELISLARKPGADAKGANVGIDRESARQLAGNSFMFEEFLAREIDAGRFKPALAPVANNALLHGHCHQKAFDAVTPIAKVLAKIPGLKTDLIDSSCCGMAGAFGYQQETYDVSLAMAERSLLPAIRSAPDDTLIIADGTSCRHQIHDGTGRRVLHVAAVLARSMAAAQYGEVVINSGMAVAESV
jgi:Fe-S oxidoreductase